MNLQMFQLSMRAFSAVMPYAKKLGDEELSLIYMTLPDSVKSEVTNEVLVFAIKKAMEEMDPNKEIPLHMRVLSHIYRKENGMPNFDWGLNIEARAVLSIGSQQLFPTAEEIRKLPDAE